MSSADIRFYFDPVCPFCWLTSKRIRMVQAERDFAVGWRFIAELKRSLREQPQLVGFGVPRGTTGKQEDWHGGSRRQKK